MRSARSRFDTGDEAGQDSFLDIVANIVGILILLVMVVGVRAARRPATEANPEEAVAAVESAEPTTPTPIVTEAEVKAATYRVKAAAKDVRDLVVRAREARSEVALQDGVRVQLAAFVAEAEEQLAEKRQELAAGERQDYDNRVAIGEAQRRLDELTRQQAAQLAVDAQVETVESLPTPLAKTVEGDEVFLMLSEGKVAVIPLDALRDQVQDRLDRRPNSMAGRNTLSFSVGPVGGFRMRFDAYKGSVATQAGRLPVVRYQWALIPNEDRLAEPIEAAIEEGSALMTELSAYPPRRTVITAVTYADSFNEFRTLKKALYDRGYAVAGRPLPIGQPLIGSPYGSRSAAQ